MHFLSKHVTLPPKFLPAAQKFRSGYVPALSGIIIYSNSTKQAFYVFALAKVFNNIKIGRKLQVPLPVGRTLAAIAKQIPLIQSEC